MPVLLARVNSARPAWQAVEEAVSQHSSHLLKKIERVEIQSCDGAELAEVSWSALEARYLCALELVVVELS